MPHKLKKDANAAFQDNRVSESIKKQFFSVCRSGNIKGVETFLQRYPDAPQWRTSDNAQTALHLASSRGHTTIAERLLNKGADINAEDMHGKTPLLIATKKSPPDYIQFILSKNADIRHRDKEGRNALFIAAARGDARIVNLLIQSGIPVNIADYKGQSALDVVGKAGTKREAFTILKDITAAREIAQFQQGVENSISTSGKRLALRPRGN